ncbi:MAG: hypothetical protein H6506_01280 [Calditrichaeota bacterium]|nr:hypothetical protein [Calditrichota bacterium]MCB9366478.1 hypothetical protein [Calditrichota bacterium]MCB9391264.1 hypothetical protein [Calditrichota bacterium]
MSTEESPKASYELDELSEDEKLLAVLAYIPFVCFVPFFKRGESAFVHGHVRLGMALFFIEVLALLLRFRFIWDLVLFCCIIVAGLGIYNVFKGRGFFVPFLSDMFTRKFD